MLENYDIDLRHNGSPRFTEIQCSIVFKVPSSLASLLALDSENEDIS